MNDEDHDNEVSVLLAVGCDVYDLGGVTADPTHRIAALAELLHAAADTLTDSEDEPCPSDG